VRKGIRIRGAMYPFIGSRVVLHILSDVGVCHVPVPRIVNQSIDRHLSKGLPIVTIDCLIDLDNDIRLGRTAGI
jgi:hypothetical protein